MVTSTCIPASKQGCIFFEWILGRFIGWGFWLARQFARGGCRLHSGVLTFSFQSNWISGGWIVQLLSSFSQKELCYQLDLKDELNSKILEAKLVP
ncbi:hypothetical protein FQP34_04425 [Peribacillus simplex]|uniref:Uncharacterized protein n=1 Tax=Peribacillus simplex TaxID=1478 RepID=A0A8B5Y2A7_9BACI|nr:hypothetical protein [Peribacillus simplex]MED3907613.1 hypothetical protein [Peribacillus simplex]TVX82847.1 hypothetical protein FQP34_04425 [Peribacillus simplex]